jgi:hypothetical protein
MPDIPATNEAAAGVESAEVAPHQEARLPPEAPYVEGPTVALTAPGRASSAKAKSPGWQT